MNLPSNLNDKPRSLTVTARISRSLQIPEISPSPCFVTSGMRSRSKWVTDVPRRAGIATYCRYTVAKYRLVFSFPRSRFSLAATPNTKMSAEPEKESAENKPEIKIVPEGTFAGHIDKPELVKEGEVIPEDTGDQGGGQN